MFVHIYTAIRIHATKQGWQTSSVEDQRVSNLGFGSLVPSVMIPELSPGRPKAVTDNGSVKDHHGALINIYAQNADTAHKGKKNKGDKFMYKNRGRARFGSWAIIWQPCYQQWLHVMN